LVLQRLASPYTYTPKSDACSLPQAGWVYLAFAFYHAAAFMLCFFHVLQAELYGFDKRINTFW
jgi:hypothetical protein